MQENMVYTPEAHIPIADVKVDHGVVYLEFKKSKSSAKEVMTLDQFLFLLYEKVYGYEVRKYDGDYYRY